MSVARKWFTVTPSNTVNLPAGCVGLYVTTNGNVSIVGADDVAVTITGKVAGELMPVGPKRVNATGTTATVVALY